MTHIKKGLGRGLDVLIKSRIVEPLTSSAEIVSVESTALIPNAHQPRQHFEQSTLEELAASIKAQGLIQPILVRPAETAGQYEIVAGERRWRACQLAGLERVQCIVRTLDDYESMAIALIENLQREDLNPLEEARALEKIKEHFSVTQEELADKIGKSRPAVTNCLRLLKLPEDVQNMLEKNELSAGHGRALLGLEHEADMQSLAQTVLEQKLTVRETEELVKKFKKRKPMRDVPKKNTPPQDIHAVLEKLGTQLQCQVSCSGTERKGRIVLSYASPEERTRLAEMLARLDMETLS